MLKKVEEDDFNDRLTYKMHDLIHDLAQSIVGCEILVLRNDISHVSREVRHVSLLEKLNPVIKDEMEKPKRSVSLLEKLNIPAIKTTMGKFKRSISLPEEVNPAIKAIMGKSIRTFLNLCEYPIEASTIKSVLPSFMCLRVLCLNNLNMEKVPKCLGKLCHLRYLDISYNGFKILPNSITRLKNLQTLKLQYCMNLKKFPKNMRELINLRHLDNHGCICLTHMPHGMGKLTSLQTLPLFVVGNDTSRWLRNHKVGNLSELESLDQQRGSLCIRNLQNVRDVKLESTRKLLENKRNLESLKLEWRGSDQNRGGEGDKWVMEGLQPNPQLKELFITGYGAKEFPSWMMNDDHELASRLPNLIKIEIQSCSECNVLPPFSQLPSLKSLKLYYMKESVEFKESSSATPVLFPSLESLRLNNMSKLKELWRMDLLADQGSSFPCLSKLYIYECCDLASLHLPPSLSKLEIHYCNKLASLKLPSSSSLSKLEIHNCSNLESLKLSSSSSLLELEIWNCSNLESLELPPSSSLSKLEITACPLLESFKMAPLPSLGTLHLFSVGYDVIQQIKFVGAPLLKCLSIGRIDRMISLPKEVLQQFSGLEKLHIYECFQLESLELPSFHALSKLKIEYCPLLASLELPSFPSLSELEIQDCPLLVSFKVAQLPSLGKLNLFSVGYDVIQQIKFVVAPSLKCLSIGRIDRMISLPKEVLQHFSGLEKLHINRCFQLESLELPSFHALSKLKIEDCPNLASFNVASLTRLQELRLRKVRAEVLRQLIPAFSSLKLLYIWGIDGEISVPKEQLQHVSTLESLYILNCSCLEILRHWMSSPSSLRALAICNCPELTSLPKEIYSLKKLETLYLSGFQLIDEDWAKIARLPNVNRTPDELPHWKV